MFIFLKVLGLGITAAAVSQGSSFWYDLLKKIVSPFLRNLTSNYLELTPREIQVANLVKEGKTTKEMTEILNISATAVDFHGKNLRSKFGIKNKKTNLLAFLSSLS